MVVLERIIGRAEEVVLVADDLSVDFSVVNVDLPSTLAVVEVVVDDAAP